MPIHDPRVNSSEVGDEELELARARVRELFFTALEAAEPARAVRNRLDWHGDCLVVGGKSLKATKGVHVVAGKGGGRYDARCPRGLAWKRRIRGRHHNEGHAGAVLPPQFRVHEAGHPIPDERGVKATSPQSPR